MTEWHPYTEGRKQHTVVGNLLIARNIYSPQLKNERNLLVWLPPSYGTTDKHYPVLYMHDGDNLFDAYATDFGEWQIDEALITLAEEGIEIIIVGIPNMGEKRFNEYCPFDDIKPAMGDTYLDFIINTIKPMIDEDYHTLPAPAHTGIAGSSMGGLISLYGFLKYPDVFGMCGAFSPVFWYNDNALYQTIQTYATGHGRVYLDIGTQEGEVYAYLVSNKSTPDEAAHSVYRDGVRQLRDGLMQKGYSANLLYVEDEGARHNEYAWAKRLPDSFRFLFKERV
jgi:predicted alpha/beta superfamily hydrolase